MSPQTRSSARVRARSTPEQSREASVTLTTETDTVALDASDSEPEMKPRPRKIARKNEPKVEATVPSKRVRGRKGKLKGLMNMPVEVFAQIAVYLYPLDLVLLARANKFFRRMLMSRSMIDIWRSAERNVDGLPPCPKELCEPQYAALVFTKYCSVCGNQALRQMDAVLQVRLCVPCRDQELTKYVQESVLRDLVPKSDDIVPGKKYFWRLRRDIEEVETSWKELVLAGNEAERRHWINERTAAMHIRYQKAQPLISFLRKIESEREVELEGLKATHQNDVESRLLKLGWEAGDFIVRDWERRRPWNSLVHVAKPLTDRMWEKLLPQLIPHLERNRDQRHENEFNERKSYRNRKTTNWLSSQVKQLEPYAKLLNPATIQQADLLGSPSDGSADTDFPSQAHSDKSVAKLVQAPYPSVYEMISWNPFCLLIGTDTPNESFDLDLAAMGPKLDELITEWRSSLEETLLKLIPDATGANEEVTSGVSDKETSVDPVSIPEFEILVDGRPFSTLSSDTKRLLRADTVFMDYSGISFYPINFRETQYRGCSYHELGSKLTKTLLASLSHQDATYMQLMASGPVFSCGRCCTSQTQTWEVILKHYIHERSIWDRVQKMTAFSSRDFTYIYTHDTDVAQPTKPFVKVAGDEERFDKPYEPRINRCFLCLEKYLDTPNKTVTELIEHMREVHLVEEPQLGKDYR